MNLYKKISDDLFLIEIQNDYPNYDSIYMKPQNYTISSRKLESYRRLADIQKYYQCNPVRFISDFFGIELLDAQAWIVQRAWSCPNVLVVATRG